MAEQVAAAALATKTTGARAGSLVGRYLELAKARLCALVLVTTLVGYLLAATGSPDWTVLGWTLVGTALAAFGANALNQWWEVERDARMKRTCGRPLPSGRLGRRSALIFALACSLGGPVLLAGFVNPLTAGLALACTSLYVLVYTPLKTRTPLNTIAGAIVGAIPPVMGWTAATGRVELGAGILAAILFLWQVPHSLALAWLYREDYARGGFRVLPVVDRDGRFTCYVIVLYTLLLVPLGLALTLAGISGVAFATGSVVLGAALIVLVIRLFRARTNVNARRVFLGSVIYLPLLLGLMVVDRAPAGPTPLRLADKPPARITAPTLGAASVVSTPGTGRTP